MNKNNNSFQLLENIFRLLFLLKSDQLINLQRPSFEDSLEWHSQSRHYRQCGYELRNDQIK